METRYEVTRLPNGLTVATAAQPHMTSVSLGLWVAVGGRYEPAALNGACHFIEHMLFKGTRSRSARDISQEVEGLGGYLNAFTGEESTCYFARAPHRQLEPLLEVLVDMLLRSRFSPADIVKERGVIKEEIAMYLDQPSQHVHELLDELVWPDHPLGRPLAGTEEGLDTLDRTALVRFQRASYTAPASLVVAAGRVSHREVVRAVTRHARHFPPGPAPGCEPVRHRQDRPRVRLFTKPTEQTQLALGIRVFSRHDERRYTLRLLNTLLGEIMSSRLFQVIREQHGLAYSISSGMGLLEDTGLLSISAGLDAEQLPRVLGLILRELRRLATTPPRSAEMRRTRDYALSQFELGLESTENQMTMVGEQWLGYRRMTTPHEVERRLSAVTADEIQRCAADLFRDENLNLALVSPLKDARRVARLLRLP